VAEVGTRLWDAATGKEILSLLGPRLDVYALAFSPDGTRLATGGAGEGGSGRLSLWDAKRGRELFTLFGATAPIGRIAFSPNGPNGQLLASGCEDGTVRVDTLDLEALKQAGRERLKQRGLTREESEYVGAQ